MKLRGTAPIALATFCCAGIATAGGGGGDLGGISQESRTVQMSTNAQTESARVSCPSNRSPISTGFQTTAEPLSGPVMRKSVLTRRGAKSTATMFDDGDHQLTGYAYCASRAPGISKDKKRIGVQPATVRKAKAECANGEHVVGGGFKTRYSPGTDFTGNVVFASYPARGGWRVAARGVNGKGGPVPLTAIAYCAHVPALDVESQRVPGFEGATPTAIAQCGNGEIAVSGGFKSAFENVGKVGRALFPNESRRQGRRSWRATGVSSFFGGPPSWKAYVLCADN